MLRTKCDGQRKLPIVIGHAGEPDTRLRASIEERKVGLGEGSGDLPRAIGPEVEKDYAVAVLNSRRGLALVVDDDNRLDELVGHAFVIRLANRGHRIRSLAAFAAA